MNIEYNYNADEFIKNNNLNYQTIREYYEKFHTNYFWSITKEQPYNDRDKETINMLGGHLDKILFVSYQLHCVDTDTPCYIMWISENKCDVQQLSKFLNMKCFW